MNNIIEFITDTWVVLMPIVFTCLILWVALLITNLLCLKAEERDRKKYRKTILQTTIDKFGDYKYQMPKPKQLRRGKRFKNRNKEYKSKRR